MKALTKVLAGGIGLAALAGAAPAAAQYYPNYPYGGGYGGYGQQGGLGAIIDQILGGNRYAYGADQRMLVERCIAAVTNRVQREYAYSNYGYPYGQGAYGSYGYAGGARNSGRPRVSLPRADVRPRCGGGGGDVDAAAADIARSKSA